MNPDLKYWNAINLEPKIGPARFKKLYNYFETMGQAWQANRSELRQAGLENKVIEALQEKRHEISPEQEMEKLTQEGIKIITIQDKEYPPLLAEISDPPALLYFKGKIPISDLAIAVVGTRKSTLYGEQVTPDIVSPLASRKITIVSGLARGIDTLAHRATLEAGGQTIAVLAGGLDKQNIYPYANRQLAEKIAQHGALISEFPLGTRTYPGNFVQRNRIISGFSHGTLVVEAPARSGALITAQFALEQNREVFAVPGNINQNNSAGPNNLIKMGAKLTSSATDVLEEFDVTINSLNSPDHLNTNIVPSTPEEAKLLTHLSKDPIHIDKLGELSKLDTSVISSTLTLMEIQGKIRHLGAMTYIINN
ncbi:MAG: DNA-protecting protein DprA [Parcubacteria group bacterium]|nr:DNA-protecting protein DprA [Parcubacteria group bacterium]